MRMGFSFAKTYTEGPIVLCVMIVKLGRSIDMWLSVWYKGRLDGWTATYYYSIIDPIYPVRNEKQIDVMRPYPGSEVHGGTTVEKQCSHVDVAIVCSNVQRGEATLEGSE